MFSADQLEIIKFWIVGGIATVVAVIFSPSEQPTVPAVLLLWLGLNCLVFRIGLWETGCHGLTGFLGGFPHALGIPGKAVVAEDLFFASLLGGCCVALWMGRRLPLPAEYQKCSAPICGMHIGFATENLGLKISCSHCQKTVTLRKPEI
jgi:hypothetical protein